MMLVVHPESEFLPIPDSEVKKAPDPGSATLTETFFFYKLSRWMNCQGLGPISTASFAKSSESWLVSIFQHALKIQLGNKKQPA
jgi:hypothetical protein